MRLKVTEQDIQKSIIEYCQLNRYVVFKHHSTGFTVRQGQIAAFSYGQKGIADIIGCLPDGRFLAIEVKRPGGKPTPEQVEFIQQINTNGGLGLIAYSLEDVIDILSAEKYV